MTAPMISRRGLLVGLGSLLAAPAIVRASSLMPVRAIVPVVTVPVEPFTHTADALVHATERVLYQWVDARVFGTGAWGEPLSETIRVLARRGGMVLVEDPDGND